MEEIKELKLRLMALEQLVENLLGKALAESGPMDRLMDDTVKVHQGLAKAEDATLIEEHRFLARRFLHFYAEATKLRSHFPNRRRRSKRTRAGAKIAATYQP